MPYEFDGRQSKLQPFLHIITSITKQWSEWKCLSFLLKDIEVTCFFVEKLGNEYFRLTLRIKYPQKTCRIYFTMDIVLFAKKSRCDLKLILLFEQVKKELCEEFEHVH